jgi:DNA-directed RNA polymerase specialized sigma24 family protein
VDDVLIAQMLRAGGRRAAGQLCERYEQELFGYAVTLAGDPVPAARALHDALVVAVAWAPYLADPRLLRPWLYSLVRAEVVRQRMPVNRAFADPAIRARQGAHEGHAAAPRTGSWGDERGSEPAPDDGLLAEVADLVHRQLMNDSEAALVLAIGERKVRALRSRADAALAAHTLQLPGTGAVRSSPPGLRDRVLDSVCSPSRSAQLAAAALPRRRSGFPLGSGRQALRRYARAGRWVIGIAAALAAATLLLFAATAEPVSIVAVLSQ